ncbi:hypothetical protein [Phascolarctobacterium succinatutens]|uniref:hypothetical protein n=1 Tax=Phascolarctobacterium succinatutens TaxID=626940 RepID=UPI0023F0A9D1|nr:hypothetical protein [Phascolarctobacterium succinatutens]
MKPEEIIYYNELTGLVEPFTQKNIDDNDAIRLGSEDFCDYIVYPEELMDLLVEEYEVFSRTPDPNVNIKFELTHVRNYIAINFGVQTTEMRAFDRNACKHYATLVFEKKDVDMKGIKGKALAKICNVRGYSTLYVYTLLAFARFFFYEENWDRYAK